MRSRGSKLVAVVSIALVACGTLIGGESSSPPSTSPPVVPPGGDVDGGDSGLPATGFTLALDPPLVIAEPGSTVKVTVKVLRAPSFTGRVDITLTGLEGVLTTSPAILAPSTPGLDPTFDLTIGADNKAKNDLTIRAQGNDLTNLVAATTMTVHVGTLAIATTANATFEVPTFATKVLIKAWGGAGGTPLGGRGGFALAYFPVTPGEKYDLVVGEGGAQGSANTGGGGGGYSAVQSSATHDFLIVAGGGGGGGGADGRGGGGGGNSGADSPDACGGLKGTPSAGGKGSTCLYGGGEGIALTGGAGGNNPSAGTTNAFGGTPGGGVGGTAIGGGGGGWFGGGGGGSDGASLYGGGGGGSGYVGPTGFGAALETATLSSPGGSLDPDYAPQVATPTFGGKIVVRFVKTP